MKAEHLLAGFRRRFCAGDAGPLEEPEVVAVREVSGGWDDDSLPPGVPVRLVLPVSPAGGRLMLNERDPGGAFARYAAMLTGGAR